MRSLTNGFTVNKSRTEGAIDGDCKSLGRLVVIRKVERRLNQFELDDGGLAVLKMDNIDPCVKSRLEDCAMVRLAIAIRSGEDEAASRWLPYSS